MSPVYATESRLKRSRNKFLLFWSLLVFIQSLVWLDWVNLGAAALAIVGGVVAVTTLFRMSLLRAYPISISMLLGYATYYFLLPPIATLIEGKALTNNLVQPILVFVHALACLFSFLIAHKIYRGTRFFLTIRKVISERLYKPLGFFNAPSNLHLVALGGVGLSGMIAGGEGENAGDIGNKFIQGFAPLTYLPYCLLIGSILGKYRPLEKKWLGVLAVFTGLLFFVAMAKNSRSVVFIGMTSVVLVYSYGLATGFFSTGILRLRNVIILCLSILIISGPLADIAVSMQVVRGQRANISSMDLIADTLSTFSDKDAIHSYLMKGEDAKMTSEWDETYVDNPFLSRLANLKFSDQSVDLSMLLDSNRSATLRDYEWQKMLAIFPKPFLDVLNLNVDKEMVSSASGGDILFYIATKSKSALGGFRTGSLFGSGYGMFGWFYILIIGLITIIIFSFSDAQTTRNLVENETGIRMWSPIFSPMTVASFFSWFFYLTSAATGVESISELTGFILRGWIQVLFIYSIAYWSTYWLIKPFDSRYSVKRLRHNIRLNQYRES